MNRKKFLYASSAVFVAVGALLSSFVFVLYGAESPGMYLLVSFIGALSLVPALILLLLALFAHAADTEEVGSHRVSPLFLLIIIILAVVYLYYRYRYGLSF